MSIKSKSVYIAVLLLAALFVALISSCSSETPQLCKISISLDNDKSRSISAEIDPLTSYTIYYKSIYKGSAPQAYGDMSNSSSFNKLTSSGILVSQGLWEIQAIFKESDQGNMYTPTEGELIASSGDIYINLNTQSITVSFTSNEGYVCLTQYELRSVPSSITDTSISVNAYKYNTETSSFDSTAIPLTLQESIKLESGVYYAVVEVKGTVSNTSKTLFTDCIGFVVRSGLTTKISGYCNTYNNTSSSGGGSFIVIDKPTEEEKETISDIKEFAGSEFSNDGTYTITGGDYTMIPTETNNFNKVLTDGQDISINMNGNAIINSGYDSSGNNVKTSFTIEEGANLTIINDNEKDSTSAKTIGFGTTASNADKEPNFSINGGTLTIGSTDPSVEGSIDLKGGPCSLNSSGIKHAAIVLTTYGGTVNLLSPGNGSYVNVEESTIGISTAFNETNKNPGNEMNININMENASIHVNGDSNDYSTGIRLDGTKNASENYGGTINISIKGTGDNGDSIKTSNENGSKISIEQSCIYIFNYVGNINLTFDENAYLLSKKGYAIALVNCTGTVKIENKGTVLGSITYNNQGREKAGNAIYLDNCSNVTIYNSGTLSADSSSYQVYSANSNVTVTKTDSNGNTNGQDVEIYSTNTSLYSR
ncbi:MAG: hypothetical protein ACI4NB_08905 [Candidatus Ornithospirochaeta sp.]